VLGYNTIFIVCQKTAKGLQRDCKENCNAFKCYCINGFINFLFFVLQFLQLYKIYRKNEENICKQRAKFGFLGFWDIYAIFTAKLQRISSNACLSMILSFAVFFAVALQWHCSTAKHLSFNGFKHFSTEKRLSFNDFKHTYGAG